MLSITVLAITELLNGGTKVNYFYENVQSMIKNFTSMTNIIKVTVCNYKQVTTLEVAAQ
jgi:hypothetical protein